MIHLPTGFACTILTRMNTIGSALSRRSVVALAACLLLAFGFFGFPPMTALLDASTPEGGGFDTELFYTPALAMEKAALFTPEGRADSARAHWTYDLAFPLCYGFFSLAAWAYGLRLLAGERRAPRYGFLLVPLAGVAFDLMENGAVAVLLSSDPSGGVHRAAAVAASAGTLLKWLFVAPAFALAIGLPVAGWIAAMARKRKISGA